MQTQFASQNPFTGEKVAKPAKAARRSRPPATEVDVATLTIADDPLPQFRASLETKYGAMFGRLKPGQCIVCEPGAVAKIAHALNSWLDKQGKTNQVKSCQRYEGDGRGRVWLLEPRKAGGLKAVA